MMDTFRICYADHTTDSEASELAKWEPVVQTWSRFFHSTLPWEDLEDLAQTARMEVLKRIRKWKEKGFSPENPESWMNRILRHIFVDYLRYSDSHSKILAFMRHPTTVVEAISFLDDVEDERASEDPLEVVERDRVYEFMGVIFTTEELRLLDYFIEGKLISDFIRGEPDAPWWKGKSLPMKRHIAGKISISLKAKAKTVLSFIRKESVAA